MIKKDKEDVRYVLKRNRGLLNKLLQDLERTDSKETRRTLVERFLTLNPSQEELVELANSDVVKYSIDFQFVLKRGFREMEYKMANSQPDSNYDFLLLLSLLGPGSPL